MSLRSENVFSWLGSFAIQYYDCNSCSLELIGFSTSLKLFLLPHSLPSSSRISRSWGGACSHCSILSPHTQDASAMLLSGHSLKQHSDYAFMDYILESGLGEAFETRLSRSNHNLVRPCVSEDEVHTCFIVPKLVFNA